MKEKDQKTNAARLLEAAGIPFRLIPYEYDENDLAATHVAEALGEDISRVFKTLVLKGEGKGYFVCVVPGDSEVDLKKAAKAIGAKKADLIPMKDLLGLTGYIRGGCTPVGMKKLFPTFFHTTAQQFEKIFVSAGRRGLQMEINPEQLAAYVHARFSDIIK